MTLDQFLLLSEKEQENILQHATKLTERIDGDNKFELFEYESFFIETKFSLLRNTRAIKPCTDPAMLDPYLVHMHLSDFQE